MCFPLNMVIFDRYVGLPEGRIMTTPFIAGCMMLQLRPPKTNLESENHLFEHEKIFHPPPFFNIFWGSSH